MVFVTQMTEGREGSGWNSWEGIFPDRNKKWNFKEHKAEILTIWNSGGILTKMYLVDLQLSMLFLTLYENMHCKRSIIHILPTVF